MTEILVTILGLLGILIGALIYLAKAQSRQNRKLTNALIESKKHSGHCCYKNGCGDKMKKYIHLIMKNENCHIQKK